MEQEIKPHVVYTTTEAQAILKVSNSTMKRLLKQGFIRATKLTHQYRILGKQKLRAVSPESENRADPSSVRMNQRVKENVKR